MTTKLRSLITIEGEYRDRAAHPYRTLLGGDPRGVSGRADGGPDDAGMERDRESPDGCMP